MKMKTIPGIYNYCDRWCERCRLTDRCAIYDGRVSTSQQQTNVANQSILDTLLISPPVTKVAHEHGLNLTLSEVRKAWQNEAAEGGPMRKQHPLSERSLDYDMGVFRWMASMDLAQNQMTKTDRDVSTIQEAATVITRYSSLIHIKLCRAISSVTTTDEWAEENGLQKDSDGSAKIALIAIERSIKAWHSLYKAMPAFEDDILSFLVSLSQLRKKTLETFPNAMGFVRPGFDDSICKQDV
jgi:hypothetical protein